ncbi:hypothetical protein ACIRD3_16570 [Kitasatospora sp. NPDC093550]|uniref:hypothetical protein n=1 Tax=Kitasatospora sp. NPDC093550 TaxID=3364089 RepID=UPI00381030AE
MGTPHRNDPAELLATAEGLRAGARNRLRGAGVPLLGLGLLALAAVPVAGQAFNFGANGRDVTSYPAFAYAQLTGLCVPHAPGAACEADEFDGAVTRFLAWGIWYALLPLAWFALARWYRRRGEARGIVPRRAVWLGATAAVGVLVAAVLVALVLDPSPYHPLDAGRLVNSYASPWYVLGLGLIVLGLTERSPLVAGTGLTHTLLLTAYLAAPWDSGLLPWSARSGGWTDGPAPKALLLAAIPLAAGLAQWTAARRAPAPSRTVTP